MPAKTYHTPPIPPPTPSRFLSLSLPLPLLTLSPSLSPSFSLCVCVCFCAAYPCSLGQPGGDPVLPERAPADAHRGQPGAGRDGAVAQRLRPARRPPARRPRKVLENVESVRVRY